MRLVTCAPAGTEPASAHVPTRQAPNPRFSWGVVMSLHSRYPVVRVVLILLFLAIPTLVFAQSPWENAATVLQQAFTSTIARAFSLIAIVVGGLTLAYGEGSGNRRMAGIIFGVGMAVGAVNFLGWLFPG